MNLLVQICLNKFVCLFPISFKHTLPPPPFPASTKETNAKDQLQINCYL